MKKIKDWSKLVALMSALLLGLGTACSRRKQTDAQAKESAQPVEDNPEADPMKVGRSVNPSLKKRSRHWRLFCVVFLT